MGGSGIEGGVVSRSSRQVLIEVEPADRSDCGAGGPDAARIAQGDLL